MNRKHLWIVVTVFCLLAALCIGAAAIGPDAGNIAEQLPLYDDVPTSAWFAPYVRMADSAGLMNGVDAHNFAPNKSITRAMFVTILYRAAQSPAVAEGKSAFSDVPAGSWYEAAVKWASANNITSGMGDGKFAPNAAITRAQLVTLLWRYAGAPSSGAARSRFTDILTSDYFWDAVYWADVNGIVDGMTQTTFAPKAPATRAQAAAILCRMLKLEDQRVTLNELQDAVTETAWAYYFKNPNVQYDSAELNVSILSKYYGGAYRVTENVAPEYASPDTSVFSVCTDYTSKCWYNGADFSPLNHPLNLVTTSANQIAETYYDKDVVVARWWGDNYNGTGTITDSQKKFGGITEKHRMNSEELRAFLSDWEHNLMPGDIFIHSGHAMIYMGNGQVTHCWGSKYSTDFGRDSIEKGGAIVYGTVDSIFLSGNDSVTKASYAIKDQDKTDDSAYFLIIRPSLALMDGDQIKAGVTMPKASRTRLQYPGMSIDRTVDITPFGTAVTGDTLTYTIRIFNHSSNEKYDAWKSWRTNTTYSGETYRNLPVTETIPAGTRLVESSISEGGKYAAGKITWDLEIEPGAYKDLTYTVEVTAPQGDVIVAEGGTVGGIPSNSISNRVGGKKLDDTARDYLSRFYGDGVENWEKDYGISMKDADDHCFAEQIYEKVLGVSVELPSTQEILDNLFKITHINKSYGLGYNRFKSAEAWMYTKKDAVEPQWKTVDAMVVDRYMGGKGVYFPDNNDRINEFKGAYLEPGDVIYMASLSSYAKNKNPRTVDFSQIVVYLGDSRYAFWDGEALSMSCLRGDSKIWAAYMYDFFIMLRPSQGLSEIKTGTPAFVAPIREVTAAETLEQRQQALVATAWAYYDKGELMQHDANPLMRTSTSSFGDGRNTMYLAPEALNDQVSWYGPVGAFHMTVIEEALQFKPANATFQSTYNRFGGLLGNFDPDVTVYEYAHSELLEAATAEEFNAMLQPGDIVILRYEGKNYDYATYLGGDDLLTLVGDKPERYNFTDGVEIHEDGGAMKLLSLKTLVTDETLKSCSEIYIARFALAEPMSKQCVSAAAEGRLAHPRMVIERTASLSPFSTAVQGSDVTYTVSVTNKSGAAYENFVITETVPALAALKDAGNAVVSGNALQWTMTVPAGKTVTVSYTVTVSAETDALGKQLVCDGGTAGGVPTGALVNVIGGAPLTADQQSTLASLPTTGWSKSGMQFAVEVYEKLGIDLKPALGGKEIASLFGVGADGTVTGKTGFFSKTSSNVIAPSYAPTKGYEDAYAMLVNRFFGGYNVNCGDSSARILEFRLDYFTPGDILLKAADKEGEFEDTVQIYLGGGKFLQAVGISGNAPTVTVETYEDYKGAIWGTLRNEYTYFCMLRPTQAFADINGK